MVIGIVGAGALGTLVGWSLAAEHEVRVLTRSGQVARTISARGGLVLEGEGARTVLVGSDAGTFNGVELVVVAVKTYDTASALCPLRGTLDASVPLVSLQNGADAVAQIDSALGPARAIALAPTTEAATLHCAGSARRTARGTTMLGWAAQRAGDERLARFAGALNACGIVTALVQPIEPHVWAKLVANAAINPLTALAGCTNGELLASADLRRRTACIAREVAAVASAANVALPFDDPVAYVERIARATAQNRSSMLQDIERDRPTEIEAIDGAVVRLAQRLGVAVPETLRTLHEVRARAKA